MLIKAAIGSGSKTSNTGEKEKQSYGAEKKRDNKLVALELARGVINLGID
jgi:hypothetical protein